MSEEAPLYGADMRSKGDDFYWLLRGEVGAWMESSGTDRERMIGYLLRIVAELQMALHANYAWRLARIEQHLELPAEEGGGC